MLKRKDLGKLTLSPFSFYPRERGANREAMLGIRGFCVAFHALAFVSYRRAPGVTTLTYARVPDELGGSGAGATGGSFSTGTTPVT